MHILYSQKAINCTNPQEEALCHEEEIKKLRESRNGLDKSFRDTSSALNALQTSHKLTLDDLKKKTAELIEADKTRVVIQKKNKDLEKVLNSTKEALRDSCQLADGRLAELNLAKQNYEVAKKNCEKLKTALEKEKEFMQSATASMTTVLNLCAPEIGTPRSTKDRMSTLADDIKAYLWNKIKSCLRQALTLQGDEA